MERAYNKMARMRTRRMGPRVKTTYSRTPHGTSICPFLGEGPYVIEEVFQGGAYQLINKEGERPCERLVFKEVPRVKDEKSISSSVIVRENGDDESRSTGGKARITKKANKTSLLQTYNKPG